MNRRLGIAVVVGLWAVSVLVATPAGAAPVEWSASFPTTGNVTIPTGATVILDTDLDLAGLTINGTVRCGSSSVRIRARWILVNGTFECGAAGNPFRKRLTITLTGAGNGDFGGQGDKFLAVSGGGKLELHGKRRRSWTTLAETAAVGATTIRLSKGAWGVGDRLVLAPTNYYMGQAEEVTIASRTGDLVTLTEPLDGEHYCGSDTFSGRTVTECAEVGLLTHNITIRGDRRSERNGIGGHTIFAAGSTVHIDGVTLSRMGQRGRLARYPIHWHHAAEVEGSIRRSTIEHAYNRFVTIHDTHGITVRDVVGFDTTGHGFYLEDGIETANRLIANLAVLVAGAGEDEALTPSDVDAAAFWISHPDNVLRGNVAAGAAFAGFWLGFPEHPLGPSATDDVFPRRTPLGTFRRNTAHTVGFAGLYLDGGEDEDRNTGVTWFEPRVDPADPDSPHVTPVIDRFTAWKSRHYGLWIRTFSGVEVRGAVLADNWRSFYLANIATGPGYDNVGLVTGSLLVGTSSNRGRPEPWEVVDVEGSTVPKHWEPDSPLGGVPFYDGPMRVEDTVLANFSPNATRDAGALTSLFPNRFTVSVLNEVEGLIFRNARRVLFPEPARGRQGDGGTLFTDVDGSVTGIPGAQVVVDPSLLDDATCTRDPAWNASVCDASYARVYVSRHDARDAAADVTRIADGRTLFVRPSERPGTTVAINLRLEAPSVIDFREGAPAGVSFWTGEFSGPGALRLAVPAPPGSWEVELWGPNRGEVGSLGALDAGGAAWFYEAATGLIHLRFTPATRGGEIG